MNEMNTTDRALSWDDEFTNEQQEFVLLPEGDYAFEVTGQEHELLLFVGEFVVPVQGTVGVHLIHK